MIEFELETVLFHGNGLLAVDKPAGVPVHKGTSHDVGLAEAIGEYAHTHPGVIDIRAGKDVFPVQHLDREATGVLLFALRRPTARIVHEASQAGTLKTKFVAVVAGPVEPMGVLRGKVRTRVSGRYQRVDSELSYRRICGDERMSLVEVTPGKSRRHLIRSLFADSSRPLCGDARYGRPRPAEKFCSAFGVEGMLLHCCEVTVPAQVLNSERTIYAPLPQSFHKVAKQKGWSDEPGFMELAERT